MLHADCWGMEWHNRRFSADLTKGVSTKMKVFCFAVFTAGLIFLGTPVFAHHGTGVSYDASNPITLQGTVTEFRYANPHPQLFFDVTDAKGNLEHWSGEFYPNPAQLIQGGWGRKRSETAM